MIVKFFNFFFLQHNVIEQWREGGSEAFIPDIPVWSTGVVVCDMRSIERRMNTPINKRRRFGALFSMTYRSDESERTEKRKAST